MCIEEEQDIVYRAPGPPSPLSQPVELPVVPNGAWSRIVVPDTRLLFRFSALTFNAHRIHYDRPYAKSEEGYPGLVVHGPLTAMLLLRLVRENTDRPVASFSFRSQAPLYDLSPFRLVGVASNGRIELQAEGPDAKVAMTAIADLA
jgi:3-methylfumaryl-CoA hydratase